MKIDRVVYRPIVEDQARLTELLTGTLDLIVGAPPDFVAQLESRARRSTLLKQVGAHVWYLGINNQKKPFDDKRVRQALNYAVNKEAIVRDVLKGTGSLSRGPVLPGTWGADPASSPIPTIPSARRSCWPRPATRTASRPRCGCRSRARACSRRSPMSTVIQSNLKAVGVNVALQTMEWGAYLAKLRTKEQELFALSWMAGNEDPDMVMYPLLHSSQWTPDGPNRALYKNEQVRRAAAPGAAHDRPGQARGALPPGPADPGRRPAVDLRRPRDPDGGARQARAGVQAPPELRSPRRDDLAEVTRSR